MSCHVSRQQITRLLQLDGLGGLAVVPFACNRPSGPALGQDKPVEWRFAHWVPPSHPMHPAAEAWAADIEKATGGTIKMKIFPS